MNIILPHIGKNISMHLNSHFVKHLLNFNLSINPIINPAGKTLIVGCVKVLEINRILNVKKTSLAEII